MKIWNARAALALVVALFAGLAHLLASPPAGAQRGQGGAGGMCAPTNAEKVALKAISANPGAWLGHCVTLVGVYSDERVYDDADAVYGISNASIGGYVDGRGSLEGFWTGEFTGRIADCAKAAADIASGLLRSPGILIDNDRQAGCKEPTGQFLLFMSQGELKPAGLLRRLEPLSGAPGQAFAPVFGDWPHFAETQAAVERFLKAYRAGDRSVLGKLIGEYPAELLIGADETSNAIAALKSAGAAPQAATFADHRDEGAAHFSTATCFCRTANCSMRWPIALRDADNRPDRPYACIRVKGAKIGAEWSYEIDVSRDYDGLPEPKR